MLIVVRAAGRREEKEKRICREKGGVSLQKIIMICFFFQIPGHFSYIKVRGRRKKSVLSKCTPCHFQKRRSQKSDPCCIFLRREKKEKKKGGNEENAQFVMHLRIRNERENSTDGRTNGRYIYGPRPLEVSRKER